MKKNDPLKMSILAALFAGLTAVGAYIAIPVGTVPFVLANMFVLLSGLLLGPVWGPISMGLYLLMGIMGLPVFAGGAAGAARLVGPTGGFLLGYPLAALVTGLLTTLTKQNFSRDLLVLLLGAAAIYALGIPWLNAVTGMEDITGAFVAMLPYMGGDGVKALLAALLAQTLYTTMGGILPRVSRK